MIVGVDTHKHVHVAVAINLIGARLATISVPADRAGYAELVEWARALGAVEAFGIEGTGSYGVGLASFVRRQAHKVVEVNHCDRRKRRNNGKSDTIDAESAARSVLSGIATAVPKTADSTSEMVRQIKIARDTAVKARSAAIITLKTLIVNAPGELREVLEPLTDRKLIDRCATLESGELVAPSESVKHALPSLASRWLILSTEIGSHDEALDTITLAAAPTLAGEVWDRPGFAGRDDDRRRRQPPTRAVRSSVCEALRRMPDPGVIGCHEPAPALPDRDRADALAPTDDRLRHPPHRRGSLEEGHHPLPQTLRCTRDLQRLDRRPPSPPRTRGSRLRFLPDTLDI